MKGHPFLIFFGYTRCPDVCPATLSDLTEVLRRMNDKPIRVLFVISCRAAALWRANISRSIRARRTSILAVPPTFVELAPAQSEMASHE